VSYGTSRACGLAELLLQNSGLHLDGVILLGCALDFNTLDGTRDAMLPDCLMLPTYAATSWYHGRTMQGKTLDEVIDFSRRFALEDYAPALMQPSRLSAIQQQSFYRDLSELIGLPVETIQKYGARIDEQTFASEFFSSKRKRIGGLDGRYVGEISTIRGQDGEDPSYSDLYHAISPAFMDYLRNDLEIDRSLPRYNDYSFRAGFFWDWSTYDSGSTLPTRPNFMQRLRRTLVANSSMKVFIGSGLYDLRTPFAATEYTIDHLELPERFRKNFQFEYYEAGHGFIFDLKSLSKFKQDLIRFYAER
jgi:carboxypeptidase C (cathepsin A)